MNAAAIRALSIVALVAVAPVWGQATLSADPTGVTPPVAEISPSRLAAGIRAYPAAVVRSLLMLSEQPLVLRQLAEQPALFENPESADPPIPAELHGAVRELRYVPEVIALVSAYPEELGAMRQLYEEAPDGMEARIAQLNAAYQAAALEGAASWQGSLEANPAGLNAYRQLVADFCQAQLKEYADFPCVAVRRSEYYYACPPNDLIMAYAAEHDVPAVLQELLESWWAVYASDVVDDRVLSDRQQPLGRRAALESVAAWPPEQRSAMWTANTGEAGGSALVPVIMQPAADQPAEARLAFAVAEHARLWAPQLPPEQVDEAPVIVEREEPPVFEPEVEPLVEDFREGDVPLHEREVVVVYDDRDDDDWYRYINTPTYHVYYGSGSCYPYYTCYPWTWPLFCDGYSWTGGYSFGTYFGYGTRPCVDYHSSGLRIGFRLGGGSYAYYNNPVLSYRRYRDHGYRRFLHRRTGQRVASHARHYYRRFAPLTSGRTARIGTRPRVRPSTRLVEALRQGLDPMGRETRLGRFGFSRRTPTRRSAAGSALDRFGRPSAVPDRLRRPSRSVADGLAPRGARDRTPSARPGSTQRTDASRLTRPPTVDRPTRRSTGPSRIQPATPSRRPSSSAIPRSPSRSSVPRRTVQPAPRRSSTPRSIQRSTPSRRPSSSATRRSPSRSSMPRSTVRPAPRRSSSPSRSIQRSTPSRRSSSSATRRSPSRRSTPRSTVRPAPRRSSSPRSIQRSSPSRRPSSSSGRPASRPQRRPSRRP